MKYKIKTDPYNYMLVEIKTASSGKEFEKIISYHRSLNTALKAMTELEIKSHINTPVDSLIELELRLEEYIDIVVEDYARRIKK